MKKTSILLFITIITSLWACKDDIAPVIVLNGDPDMELVLNQAYEEPGFTAYDDKDGDLTASVVASELNVNVAGQQTITYTVNDEEGNQGMAIRKVNVFNELEGLDGTWSGEFVMPYPGTNKQRYGEIIELSTSVNRGVIFKNFANTPDANVSATVSTSSLSFNAQNVGGSALSVQSAVLDGSSRITIEFTIGSTKGVLVLVKN